MKVPGQRQERDDEEPVQNGRAAAAAAALAAPPTGLSGEQQGVAFKLAAARKVPIQAAEAAVRADEEQASRLSEQRARLLGGDPVVTRWTTESPGRAALAADDLPALAEASSAVQGRPGISALLDLNMAAQERSGLSALAGTLETGSLDTLVGTIHMRVALGLMSPEEAVPRVADMARRAAALRSERPEGVERFLARIEEPGETLGEGVDLVQDAASGIVAVGGAVARDVGRRATAAVGRHLYRMGLVPAEDGKMPERLATPEPFAGEDQAAIVAGLRAMAGAQRGVETVAEGLLGVQSAVAAEPGGALVLSAESAPHMAPAIALAAAGAAFGPVGVAAGRAAGSATAEFGAWISQRLGEMGVDGTDEAALLAMYRDAEWMSGVRWEASRRAAAMGAFDIGLGAMAGRRVAKVPPQTPAAAPAGLMARAARDARRATGAVPELAVEIAEQSVGEAAQEAVGQLAARGEVDPLDVVLEGVLTAPTSAAFVGIGAMARARRTARQEAASDALRALATLEEAEVAEKTADALGRSKAAQAAPDEVALLVAESATVGERPSPTVSLDAVRAIAEQQGIAPSAAAEALSGSEAAWAEAVETGELAVPYERFVMALSRGEIPTYLLDQTRFRRDGPTVAEARTELAGLSERMADVQAQVDETAAGESDAEQDAALEERAAEVEQSLGLPEGSTVLFQSGDQSVPGGEALRKAADAIEGVAEPGLLLRAVQAITGAEPVADAVRAALPSGDAAEALAAAAQADPAGTASALRELASVREAQQAGDRGAGARMRERFRRALSAAGRPAAEARAGADVLRAFVETMQQRYPEVAKALADRFVLRFSKAQQASEGGEGTLRQGGDTPRASLSFDPEARGARSRLFDMAFYPDANASSVFHKSAHFMLEVFHDLASQPEASLDLRNEYAALRAELGEADVAQTPSVALHERFAQLFEEYLRRGKAPSARLRRAFAAIRQWMLRLYEALAIAGWPMSDQVVATFDRMLATDREIERANAEGGMEPLWTTPEELREAGVPEDIAAQYLRAALDAADAERARLTRKTLAALAASQREERRAEMARVRAEIEAGFNGLPAAIALANMRDGTLPDGSPLPEGASRVQLSLEALADLPDNRKRRLRALGVVAEGGAGVPAELAAGVFGYDGDVEGFLDGILLAANRRRFVETLARARLEAERPDLLTDRATLAEAARRAVGRGGRQQVMVAELRVLRALAERDAAERARAAQEADLRLAAQRVPPDRTRERAADAARKIEAGFRRAAFSGVTDVKTLRERAQALLAERALRDIRPNDYLHVIQREGRAMRRHVAAGAFQLAAAAEERRALALALYREARGIRDAAERVRAFAKRMRGERAQAILTRAGHTYRDQLNAILNEVAIGRETLTEADAAARRREWVAYVEEQTGRAPAIPESVLERSRRRHYLELTLSELQDVRAAVESIYHIARTKDRLMTARRLATLDAEAKAVAGAANASRPARARTDGDAERRGARTRMERLRERVAGFVAAASKLSTLARLIDGNTTGDGPAFNAFTRRLGEARSRWNVLHGELASRLKELDSGLGDRKKGLHKKRRIPGTNLSMSRADTYVVALLYGSNEGRQRMTALDESGQPINFSAADLQAILATLDEVDGAHLNRVYATFDAYFPEIADQQRRLFGARPEKVAPVPFKLRTAAGGEFEVTGGYFPLAYDDAKGQVIDADKLGQAVRRGEAVRQMTRIGYMQQRLASVGRPVLIDYSLIARHLQEVIHDIAWQAPLLDAHRILSHADVRDAIVSRYGIAEYRAAQGALDAVAGGALRYRTAVDGALNHMRHGTSVATLGFRLVTMALQPTGIFHSMQHSGVGTVLSGMKTWFGQTPGEQAVLWDWIEARSPFMAGRVSSRLREMAELSSAVDPSITGSVRSRISDAAYYGIGRSQLIFVDIPTWLGVYEKAMNEQPGDEGRAIALADAAVEESQGDGSLHNLSDVQRHHRWLTLFWSYMHTKGQLARMAWARFDSSDPGAYWRLAVDGFLLLIGPAIVEELIRGALRKLRGDEEDEPLVTVGGMAGEVASQALGFLPLGAELAGIAQGRRDYNGPAALRLLSVTYDAGSKIRRDFEAGEFSWSTLRPINVAAGIIFHYPADFVDNVVRGIGAMLDGDAGPAAALMGPPRR